MCERKDASEFTKRLNEAVLGELPFDYTRDFEDAARGFIAPLNNEYRWVAEVVNKVVFADPQNREARQLQADTLEQMGYQAESGSWRGHYLTGARELRHGTPSIPLAGTATPDTVRAMSGETDLLEEARAGRIAGYAGR